MIKRLLAFSLLPLCAFAQEESQLPPFQRESSFSSEIWGFSVTLGVILFFLVLAAWALKRMMASRVQILNESSRIKILERRNLAPKLAVYVLEVEGKGIVICETPTGVELLTTFKPDETE